MPAQPAPLCVHVIDDEEQVRRMIAFMLASEGFFPRVYASAAAFIAEMPSAPGGCVLTDLRMPDMSGIGLAAHIKQTSDRFCVVVMSGCADISLAVEAMKNGAVDFLQKPFTQQTLLATISTAFEQLKDVRPSLDHERDQYRTVFSSLTPREHDVLRGMLAGKLNKTIAHGLGLSVRTVEGYRSQLVAKTQTHSLSELVRIAVLAGL